jgi:hypothetical protein
MGTPGGLRMLRARKIAGIRITGITSQKTVLFFLGFIGQNLQFLFLKNTIFKRRFSCFI